MTATAPPTAGEIWLDYMPLSKVRPAKRNPKGHAEEDIDASLDRFGYTEPVFLDERTGRLVAGHGRLGQLRTRKDRGDDPPPGIRVDPTSGEWLLPVNRGWRSANDREAEAYLLASNRLTELGGWINGDLLAVLREQESLVGTGFAEPDVAALLAAQAGAERVAPRPTLADRFLVPPFSILDARSGPWRERKERWLALGIRSEIGRSQDLVNGEGTAVPEKGLTRRGNEARSVDGRVAGALMRSDSGRDPRFYAQKRAVEARLGREITTEEFQARFYVNADHSGGLSEAGTSVFDPVVCELAYRWFSPPGGTVVDPFAGGSVRGIVAALTGRSYLGIDLRPEQIEANQAQVAVIAGDAAPAVDYRIGDARDILPELPPESTDLIFTCPPYYDLEVYSEDPRDLSAMTPADFDTAYRQILAAAARALRPDRLAVVVVGNVRDRDGLVRDLRALTTSALESSGLRLYNDAVLVTMAGSLPVRAGRSFAATRVLGRTHQEVLVFVKGDRRAAARACGDVEADVLAAIARATSEDEALPDVSTSA